MKKLFFLLFCLLTTSVSSMAETVVINNIRYSLNASDGTATVLSNNYSGDIVIPSSVTYNSTTYSVTSIGNNAFQDCSGLTFIELPPSLKIVGNNAFQGCNNLRGVKITDLDAFLRISFGWYAPLFYAHHLYLNGKEVTGEIVFPSDITSVSNVVFEGCYGITSVVIPEGVKTIGQAAFKSCPNLKSVKMPSTLTDIAREAFQNCTGLTSITIGSGLTSIGDYAFSGCTNITSLDLNCKTIGNWFGDSKTSITSVTLGEGVTSIGDYAFQNCTGLTSVTIGSGVTSIGERAFAGCSGLTSIDIPYSVTSIGLEGFADCTGLDTFVFPMYLNDIGVNVLANCHVTSVILPISVTNIGQGAFVTCQQLRDVYCYTGDVPQIHSEAFYNLNTQKVTLHVRSNLVDQFKNASTWNSLGNIVALTDNDWALRFRECFVEGNLVFLPIQSNGNNRAIVTGMHGDADKVVVPSTVDYNGETYAVTGIGGYAFYGYSGLTSIEIPNSVTSIDGYAFFGCEGLKKVIVRDIAAWYGINFKNGYSNPLYYAHHLYSDEETEIKDLVIPNSVTSIGNFAFFGCSGLTSIEIPNSVTSIGWAAFCYCSSLTSITIPNSVKSIDSYAFYDCI